MDWGDGSSETSTSNALSHTYSAGTYTINISSDIAYGPKFNATAADVTQITSVEIEAGINLGSTLANAWYNGSSITSFVCAASATSNVTNLSNAWRGCPLTSFPLINTSQGTNFYAAWNGCTALTSFPAIDTSSGTNFNSTWVNCRALTSFPALVLSGGTNFSSTWLNNYALASFPALDLSSSAIFSSAWKGCTSLTTFGAADVSNGTSFSQAWYGCTSLTTFPANMFDTATLSTFASAWTNCALTATSIENILVSLDTNGTSSISLSLSGGTNAAYSTWTTDAVDAYDSLISKSWTISYNT